MIKRGYGILFKNGSHIQRFLVVYIKKFESSTGTNLYLTTKRKPERTLNCILSLFEL